MSLSISSLTKEFIRVQVSAEEAGAAVNPTSKTVELAATAVGSEPVGGDWKTAAWETDATTTPDTYYARATFGTGATVVVTDGTYAIWVRITDATETVVRKVGELVVD